MKIGIDASRANKSNRTGVEWYSYYIIQELKKFLVDDPDSSSANHPQPLLGKEGGNNEIEVVLYSNEKLGEGLEVMPKLPPLPEGGRSDAYRSGGVGDWKEVILSWPPKYLWTQIRLWWELVVNPPDVLFIPAHTIPFLPISKKIKIICAVHDVGFKRFPELYKKIQFWYHDLTMRRIRGRADVILTISQFSKSEIVDLYGVDPNKIKITYLGYDDKSYHVMEREDTSILEKYKISKPYILYVGRLEKKKNIGNIIDSFILIKKEQSGLKLVLAGNPGNDYDQLVQKIKEAGIDKDVIITGYVAESDMPQLFASAEVFLFPTLYEGFGLPIVQAMASGTPVVTSDCNPHKEIAGEAGIFVDPHSALEIYKGLKTLFDDPIRKQQLVEAGFKRAANFHWSKTAENTVNILMSKN